LDHLARTGLARAGTDELAQLVDEAALNGDGAREGAFVTRSRLRQRLRILDELDETLGVQTTAERELVVVDGFPETL
jgi:hypothetical protein